jgi:hypothetical protein
MCSRFYVHKTVATAGIVWVERLVIRIYQIVSRVSVLDFRQGWGFRGVTPVTPPCLLRVSKPDLRSGAVHGLSTRLADHVDRRPGTTKCRCGSRGGSRCTHSRGEIQRILLRRSLRRRARVPRRLAPLHRAGEKIKQPRFEMLSRSNSLASFNPAAGPYPQDGNGFPKSNSKLSGPLSSRCWEGCPFAAPAASIR